MVNQYDVKGHPNIIWGSFTDSATGNQDVFTVTGHNIWGAGNNGHAADFRLDMGLKFENARYDEDNNLHITFKGLDYIHFQQWGHGSADWRANLTISADLDNNGGLVDVVNQNLNAGDSYDSGVIHASGSSQAIDLVIKPEGDTTNLNRRVAKLFNTPDNLSPSADNSDWWEFYIDSVTNNSKYLDYVPFTMYKGGHSNSLYTHQGQVKVIKDGQPLILPKLKQNLQNIENQGNTRYYKGVARQTPISK